MLFSFLALFFRVCGLFWIFLFLGSTFGLHGFCVICSGFGVLFLSNLGSGF